MHIHFYKKAVYNMEEYNYDRNRRAIRFIKINLKFYVYGI